MIYLYTHRTSYGDVHRFFDVKTVRFYSVSERNNQCDYFILHSDDDGMVEVERTQKFYYNIDKIIINKVVKIYDYTEKMIIEKLILDI